jgi:integrase
MVIRMKGVKRVLSKGRVYYYHRRTMTRRAGEPGTTEFMDGLAAAERGSTAPPPLPGTLDALIGAYRAAPEFTGLAARTKADYQKVFDYLKPLGPLPLGEVDRAFLYAVRDKAFGRKKRRFANYVLQVLSRLFNWGKSRGIALDNPAADVETIRRPRDAPTVNRRWTDAEFKTVMAEAADGMRIAIGLGGYIGFREGDAIAVAWSRYDGTAFEVNQGKTGAPLWVPVHRELKLLLDAWKSRRSSPIIVVGAKGRPYTQTGFQTMFFGLLRRLKAEGKIGEGLSFHGLRHTVGNRLAEAGCDTRTIAAMLGQRTTAMAEHYSRAADRKHLVREAVTKLERNGRQKRKTSADRSGKPDA